MTNHELRRRAWGMLRKHPLRLLGLTALLAVPFFLAALWVALVYGLMLFNDLFVLYTDAAGAVRLGVTHGLTYGQLIPYITGMSGGVFFVGIVSQGLLAGYMHCMIQFMRGEVPTVRTLLGRMDACLKMLGLEVLVVLKALLRVIPFLLLLALVNMMFPGAEEGEGLAQLVLIFAPMAQLVLLARLMLSHALAGYVIAEQPKIRICDAIARSKAAMKGCMWRYFGLYAPYLLTAWAAAAVLAGMTSVAPSAEGAPSLLTAGLYAVLALLGSLAGAGFYADRCAVLGETAKMPEEALPAMQEAPAVEETKE